MARYKVTSETSRHERVVPYDDEAPALAIAERIAGEMDRRKSAVIMIQVEDMQRPLSSRIIYKHEV